MFPMFVNFTIFCPSFRFFDVHYSTEVFGHIKHNLSEENPSPPNELHAQSAYGVRYPVYTGCYSTTDLHISSPYKLVLHP